MSIDHPKNDAGLPSEDQRIENEIERAKSGDASVGRELLRSISLGLSSGDLHPLLAQYHADCLWNHTQLGVSLERALHVYKYQIKSTAFDPIELAAVFELLIEFAGMKKGEAKTWIRDHIGASKKTTENASAAVNIQALGSFDRHKKKQTDTPDPKVYGRERFLDLLLHTAGSMRQFVVGEIVLK